MSKLTKEQQAYFSDYAKNDTNFKEELEKYTQAIPSRAFIQEVLNAAKKVTFDELAAILNLKEDWQLEALSNRLYIMNRARQLHCNVREEFLPIGSDDTVIGLFEGSVEGHGYVTVKDQETIYISPKDCKNVMHHDEVEVVITGVFRSKSMRQGRVVKVVKRNLHELIARISMYDGSAVAVPENRKISQHFLILEDALNQAKNHDLVKIEVDQEALNKGSFIAKVTEVFGRKMTKDIAIIQAIMEHQLPHEFSKATDELLKTISDEVREEDKVGRKDYRDLPLVTIDGITARDFDDAVYVEKMNDGNFKLYVAIADVAHYVRNGNAIDADAIKRGTSVYFPDRVIPMLPEKLSNGLCSLNPNVDRLCMVCEMIIAPNGEMEKYEFFEGVMRSHARLTYELVAELIIEENPIQEDYSEIMPHILNLYSLYKVLRKARDQRGSIDFETKETEILYNDEGLIDKIEFRVRNEAHMIIEECMIAANIAAATFLESNEVPTLYRVHAKPPEERLNKLRRFLVEYNLGVEGGDAPEPKDYAKTLAMASELPVFDIIQTMMLRSMAQAVYQPENEGHFGLSLTHYAHFTSPIRRYPDLTVHRGIKSLINKGKEGAVKYPYTDKMMVSLGESLSEMERRADDAVSDVVAWLKCEYMQQHIGKVLSGRVAGITKFGVFVELDDIYIEGLVHMSNLPGDYYHFDDVRYRLIGEKTGVLIKLNDSVVVRVLDANPETKFIDFEMITLPKNAKLSKREREAILAEIAAAKAMEKAVKKQSSKKGRPDNRKVKEKRRGSSEKRKMVAKKVAKPAKKVKKKKVSKKAKK
ncbi:ribonuclease R [Wohlfahrtiimonas larvae]|uniref:Ribonuclease R n=1 Tax=Wohlfahrtiimonas larvae TaxID=1157986 RepID=A0ABP9MQV6_9GAMM|nr:ribonuclease R [Wohlfahrtiimonas larvae]